MMARETQIANRESRDRRMPDAPAFSICDSRFTICPGRFS